MKILRMGENICKWSNWQGINLQNIKTLFNIKKKTIQSVINNGWKKKEEKGLQFYIFSYLLTWEKLQVFY